MSWQEHCDSLMNSGNFDDVAIVNAEDGKELASTPGFTVGPDEAKQLAVHLAEGAEKRREITAGGKQYSVMSQLPGIIFGRLGFFGVTIYQTKEAIIVGVFPGIKNKDARETIEKVTGEITSAGH